MGKEYLIKSDRLYKFRLTRQSSISLKFHQGRANFKELEFIGFSPKMSAFRMYVSNQETATSENSLLVIPSWIGGYFTSVRKDSRYYCVNCNFTILLEPEYEHAEVFFIIRYENSVSQIKPHFPIFSTLKPFKTHCYKMNIPEKYKNDELIIQTELFSGSANLLYNPWSLPDRKNLKNFKLNKPINGEDVTIVNSTLRGTDSSNGKITGSNYICLKSYDYTSYLMKVYFSSQVQNLQKFNFLFSGVSLSGYLPADKVTKYRITEFTPNSDIFIKMKTISGKPKVYGYVCENARRFFLNKKKLKDLGKILIIILQFFKLF